jgi:acyl dehydratase
VTNDPFDIVPLFESLAVGQLLPELTRGPLIEPHLMRWSAAIENWHRIHYDVRFATVHDGLPDLLINGSWKQHFLVEMVRRWSEPTGWLKTIGFDFRKMDLVGSTLTATALISSLSESNGYGWVGLDIGIRNETSREVSTTGSAAVVLPLSGGAAVPYPFPQSLRQAP